MMLVTCWQIATWYYGSDLIADCRNARWQGLLRVEEPESVVESVVTVR